MKSYVGTFNPRSGTGTQTVTGIVDQDGQAFTPVMVWFFSTQGAPDTVVIATNDVLGQNAYTDNAGVDLITKRAATATADYYYVFSSFKATCGGQSSGEYSLLGYYADIFFAGTIWRKATITAVTSGGFTLTYDLNDATGDTVLMVVMGGDDLVIDTASDPTPATATKATSGTPTAVMTTPFNAIAASGSTATSAGGSLMGWGWDTKTSGRGAMCNRVVVGNYRAQRTTQMALIMDGSGVLETDVVTVGTWGASSYTLSGLTGILATSLIAFSGVSSAAGSITQPTATGSQVFTTGINTKFLMFASIGAEADPASQTESHATYGWASSIHRQAGYWTGEVVVGNGTPLKGARYLDTANVLRFATANAGATTFDATASVTAMLSDGTVELTWDTVDSTPREILWFALGDAATPATPSYTTVPVVQRRLRQAPHLVSELTRQYISKFQVHLQPGIGDGTGQGADPLVMFQYSKDGGETWSNERLLPAGEVGEYARRCIAWRLGVARDWVFRVSVTDPNVPWALVAAYLDGEKGSS